MKLIQLQFLVGLKKYGTFSKTAKEMYISQPVISMAIKALEEELGRELLERSNKGATFTPFGELVLEQAEVIEQAVNNINNICYQGEIGLYGSMNIASLPHLCNTILLEIQLEMGQRYPNFKLNLENAGAREIIDRVGSYEWNMGLVQSFDLDEEKWKKKMEQKGLQYRHMFYDELMFVAGKQHPLHKKENVTVEELLQYPYLSYSEELSPKVSRLFQEYHYTKDIICIREFVRMRKYAACYDTVTCLPRQAVVHGNLNYRDKLIPLKVKGLEWETSVGVVSKRGESGEAGKIVMQMLKEECARQGLCAREGNDNE